MITKPGIYKISNEEYHNDPCLDPSLSRSSIGDLLFKSPAHCAFNHPRLNPNFVKENDRKFDLGTAAHAILLEGIESIHVIDAGDYRKKEVKEERENAIKEGKAVLLAEQYYRALKMVAEAGLAIGNCKELGISDLSKDGQAELSYLWKEDNAWIRARPDWISNDKKLILDYKTTEGSANPSEWARVAISNGYDIQAALYSRGVKALDAVEPKFVFVVQEAYDPFLCSFISLPPDFLAMGKQKVEYGIYLWRKYLMLDQWPGYPNKVAWIDPPAWALTSWEQRASELGEGK